MITEMVADQVAPSYWVPNKDVLVRMNSFVTTFQRVDRLFSA